MEHCILVIDFENNNLKVAHQEWLKHNILLCVVNSIPDAIKELSERNFLFIAVFSITEFFLVQLQLLRQIKPVSILIYPQDYDISKRTLDFFSGTDNFFGSGPDASLLIEKSKDFFGYLERHDNIPPVTIHTHKDIFLVVEYRKVFVRGREVEMARADFDMLELLMSQAGRVFEYDQIYHHVYGNDTPIESMINSVHSHINRIRKKIRLDEQSPKYIDSVRSVGYRMSI